MPRQHHFALAHFYTAHSRFRRSKFDLDQREQIVNGRRKCAETIAPLSTQSFELISRGDLRNFSVRSYPHGRIAHVSNRNECGNAFGERLFPNHLRWKAVIRCWRCDELCFVCHHKIESYVHIHSQSWFLSFQLRHCLLEQLTVQVETDRHDVAALRGSENATRAANLQVAHGDAKAGSQGTVLLDRA